MELSSAALWLNSAFAGYDGAILGVMHTLADKAGVILTPLMRVISFLGEKGIIFFLLALAFMCFSKTRRMGICLFGAVCCGALITNIFLKDLIARPRPFETVEAFGQWWTAVGSPAEDGFSFPSGHVTATAAGMTALCLMRGKKLVLPSVLVVLFMAVSRNYLMAHYPSDVLFAAIIGCASAFIAFFITKLIYRFLHAHEASPLCSLLLEFDVPIPAIAALAGKLDGQERQEGPSASGRSARQSHGGGPDRAAPSAGKSRRGYKGKHEG